MSGLSWAEELALAEVCGCCRPATAGTFGDDIEMEL